MRRRLRLRHLSRLYRRRLGREGRQTDADGRGYARLRLRRAAEFAIVLPDQGKRRTRRPRGYGTGTAGLSTSHSRLTPAHKAASGVTLAGRGAGAATVYGFP